jgi:predicted DNA-binding transcriptional regulator AlpA
MRALISKAAVAERLGYHPGHLMRLVREGKFPKPIKLGQGEAGAVRFVESEVDAWLDAKLAERTPA